MAYTNPIGKASLTPERIDMGVDYAGTGPLLALGNGVVTQVNPGGWGQYGNYMQYQLTDGPDAGKYIYYAEGITPTVKVGDKVSVGQVVANLIPGFHSGIELGFGAAGQDSTYASVSGGGYSEGARTASGQAFSDLVRALGGYPGLAEGRPVTGTAPALGDAKAGGVVDSVAHALGYDAARSALGSGVGDIAGSLFNDIFGSLAKNAKYAALALVVIVGGFVLIGKGVEGITRPTPVGGG